MFEELDNLLKLTKCLEAVNSAEDKDPDETESEEESEGKAPKKKNLKETDSIGAFVYDAGFGSDAYDPDQKPVAINVDGEDEDGHDGSDDDETATNIQGSSSNANPSMKPLFEKNDTDDELEAALSEGLGIRGALHKSIHAMECCDGILPNRFSIGDLIRMSQSGPDGQTCPSVIFIVKNCDGDMITAAKPTAKKCDCSIGHEGSWPEFYFQQDEIAPLGDTLSSIDVLKNIIRFNDAKVINECNLTGGHIVDDDTYKKNQKAASANQFDKKVDEVWENMFGQSISDCVNGKCSPDTRATLDDVIKGKVGAEHNDTTHKPVIKMAFESSLNEGVEKVLHGTIFDY